MFQVRHAQGVHNVAGEKDLSAYICLRNSLMQILLLLVGNRNMQTTVGAFGGEASTDGVDMPPLMAENTSSSNRPAISSLNCPPFIAMELCRESMIEIDHDVWWSPDTREKKEDVAARGGSL
ncbi:hypothetical protein Hdeb2414_s0443g00894891 [Helianthus debilis subsp. tardiflorus]